MDLKEKLYNFFIYIITVNIMIQWFLISWEMLYFHHPQALEDGNYSERQHFWSSTTLNWLLQPPLTVFLR